MRRPRAILAPVVRALGVVALTLIAACGGDGETGEASVTRETLPNGATLVRHRALPAAPADTLRADLTIGALQGEDHEVFGDVRGIEADSDGRVYVFDAQTTDVRVFEPDGRFVRRIGRQGQGPGEIVEANGMVFDREGVLWIHDHGSWRMVGFDTEGREVARSMVPARSYGYIYAGAVDHRGRFWKTASHSDGDEVVPPPSGLNEGTVRMYAKWHDPASETTDSMALFEADFRSHVEAVGNGYSVWSIPFDPRVVITFDPAGGLWTTAGDTYRLARLNESGDTVLVVEVDAEPVAVADAERAAWVESMSRDSPARRRIGEELVRLGNDVKPAIDQLVVDDRSRLWVRRVGRDGEPPRYDVFTRDGDYAGSVVLAFAAAPYVPPRVRNGRLYALILDELDVPRVVGAGLPALTAGAS